MHACLSVVGNKNDEPVSKVVLTEDAQQFANQMGIDLFETSAKENINVEEVDCLFLERPIVADLPSCLNCAVYPQNNIASSNRN